MGARTSSRESALQVLFAMEAGNLSAEKALAHFWRLTPGDPEGRDYAEKLVRGIGDELTFVDGALQKASSNWRLERMPRVDRNVLRIGAFELLRCNDVPRAVVIDEAIELAKRFGTEESSAFVNGVLNKVAENVGRIDTDR